MRHLDLREFKESEPIRLSIAARRELRDSLPSLGIAPAPDLENAYVLLPGATIGALEIEDLSVSIRPKLGIGRVLFLASYAMGAFRLRDSDRFDFRDEETLVESLVPGFASSARRAFARGLLHGYRMEEETLQVIRGRIRIGEQIRRRFGAPVPIEVRYDDFTEDILMNRLVKAAAVRLGLMRIRSRQSRVDLGWIDGMLENVTLVEFPSNALPSVSFQSSQRALPGGGGTGNAHPAVLDHRDRTRRCAGGGIPHGHEPSISGLRNAGAQRSPRPLEAHVFVPIAAFGVSLSTRVAVSDSSRIFLGGMDRIARSSAMPSTSGFRTSVCPMLISISFSRTSRRSIYLVGCLSTPRARPTTWRIGFATLANDW